MASNPLTITDAAVNTHAPKLICEFCGCQLAPSGEVMKLGNDAKKFRDFPDERAVLEKRITALESEITELKRQLSEATEEEISLLPPTTPKKSGLFST